MGPGRVRPRGLQAAFRFLSAAIPTAEPGEWGKEHGWRRETAHERYRVRPGPRLAEYRDDVSCMRSLIASAPEGASAAAVERLRGACAAS